MLFGHEEGKIAAGGCYTLHVSKLFELAHMDRCMCLCCHGRDFWKEVPWFPSVLNQKKVQLKIVLAMHVLSLSRLRVDSHAVLTDKEFQLFCKNTEIMLFSSSY